MDNIFINIEKDKEIFIILIKESFLELNIFAKNKFII